MQESHQRCRGSNSDRPSWRYRERIDSATRAGADWRLRWSFVSKKMADGVVRPEERCSGSRPEERCSGSRPAGRDVSEEIGYRREIGLLLRELSLLTSKNDENIFLSYFMQFDKP